MIVERRLMERGWILPAPIQLPPGVVAPFAWVRLRGNRAYISGHGALQPDGSPAGPFGRVPTEVSLAAAADSAELAALAMLGSLKAALGDLDRVTAWLTINGHVNADPGFAHTTAVINPVSELVVALFGSDVGQHARTAIGAAALPLNLPVVLGAEVEVSPGEPS